MENKTPLIAGGVGVVVLSMLFGWMFSSDNDENLDALEKAQAEIGERLDGLQADNEAVASQLTGLTTRLDEVQTQLTEQLASAGSVTDELKARMDGLSADMETAQGALADAVSSMSDTAEPVAVQAPVDEAVAEVADAAVAATSSVLAGAGQTVTLGDNLRVFLSRADAEAGTAMVAVNGLGRTTLRVGQPAGVTVAEDFCHLTLNGISDAGLDLSHVCGVDVPAPVGIGVGQTHVFEEGARAFLSRLDPANGVAEVAVNGLTAEPLTFDTPLRVRTDAGRCELVLANIDRGHAALSLNCPE